MAAQLERHRPQLLLVPEENSLGVERLLVQARQAGIAHAALHHTAEVWPPRRPERWQRQLLPRTPLLMPLRSQVRAAGGDAAALLLDPVRAHLLAALELEGPLDAPSQPAVGWLHYPLQQQALAPLADPLGYWACIDQLARDLAADGIPLLLARKPPLEPAGPADAIAQGLTSRPTLLPLAQLLERSSLVIAPGHLGTAHLEAIARGRPLVVVTPPRLRRPSLLLQDSAAGAAPLPRLEAAQLRAWLAERDGEALVALARQQRQWLRAELTSSEALGEWLRRQGVPLPQRPQGFLGSGLATARPLLERVEALDRISRRLQRLRHSPLGRLLGQLRRRQSGLRSWRRGGRR